jgi:hypothetical protein
MAEIRDRPELVPPDAAGAGRERELPLVSAGMLLAAASDNRSGLQ